MKFNERNLVYYATSKSPVDKSGFLSKRGERNVAYHKRWFVLKGNMLFYYDHEESREPVGVIILEGCRVELCESTEEYAFAIKFEHAKSRSYILAADSQSAMESWVKALTRANFEYIRLVVKELQKQLEEMQKTPKTQLQTKKPTDANTLNASSRRACHIYSPNFQDWLLQKDNCCATWGSIKSDMHNGLQVNGPNHGNTVENSDELMGADGHQSSLLLHSPSETRHGVDRTCPTPVIDEECEDNVSFSKLNQLFGEEIVAIKAKWKESFQERYVADRDSDQ
ncbi:sesquipedalian-1 [Pelodytes ibericus]